VFSLVSRLKTGEFALHRIVLLPCLALAACGVMPEDVSGTADRIEQTGSLRIGLTELRPEDEVLARRLVGRLEQLTGARATFERGPAERELARLEEGELDLVISEFASDTPWAASVAIVEPLASRRAGSRTMELAPAVMNGENRWVALVEREVRDSAGGGA
jgi:hypothetical protein